VPNDGNARHESRPKAKPQASEIGVIRDRWSWKARRALA